MISLINNVLGYNLAELAQKPLGEKFIAKCRETIAEGIVLLKNEENVLPLKAGDEVSIFGRMQTHYVKGGSGSGGLVNAEYITNIVDGLERAGLIVNRQLKEIYREWEESNPVNMGNGWSSIPWSQTEMPLDDKTARDAAEFSDTAIVIIGRSSGEDKDNVNIEGSYLLTKAEEDMLSQARKYFSKVIVLLNVGNIIDMKWIERYNPDAVLYVWQGGQEGGNGVADVVMGKCSPSGKLTDTIAYDIKDYPSTENFNGKDKNFYCEDVYVGYRYFNTFARDKVIYPFGFGLSYTNFKYYNYNFTKKDLEVTVKLTVENIGDFNGKEIVQIYCSAPNGKLGKPERVLVAYKKTKELKPRESETIEIKFSLGESASFDDTGVTGFESAFVLEKGDYKIFVSSNAFEDKHFFEFSLNSDILVKQCQKALSLAESFERIKPQFENGKYTVLKERVWASSNIPKKDIPKEIKFTGDKGLKLRDVKNDKCSMEEFIAQLSDEDLSYISMGEGMNSPKVTPGCCAAFGGITADLYKFGIPIACTTDGPSGIRIDSGAKATLMPNGTLIACTWNDEIAEELYTYEGIEMYAYNIDVILGPGINIHRNPLCGRNFEYFSEDPLLTGNMAAAICRGLSKSNTTATIKHFCANNQERDRNNVDSVVSERALREIYLKPFEIALKENTCKAVMTSFNPINGVWACGNYDLTTRVLRDEWNYDGFVMSDWWAKTEKNFVAMAPDGKKIYRNFEPMIYAQNDIYMAHNDVTDTDFNSILSDVKKGKIERALLQRNAINICNYLMDSNAMNRLHDVNLNSIEVIPENKTVEFSDLSDNCEMVFDCAEDGCYIIEVELGSKGSELSQNTIVFYLNGKYAVSFTVQGADGGTSVHKGRIDLEKGECELTAKQHNNRISVKKVAIYKS